jgi:hypothetical protein
VIPFDEICLFSVFHSYYCTVFTFTYFFAVAAFVLGWELSVNASTRAKFVRRPRVTSNAIDAVRATLSSAQGTETSGGIPRINIGTRIQEWKY